MSNAILYDYWRSTASYRVRIALNLADIAYESRTIDLVSGQQNTPEHLALNPQGFVPVLEIDGLRLTQSLSIIEYLDETRNLGLLPTGNAQKARVRALAQIIACDIHPVCNLSVVGFATKNATDAQGDKTAWMQYFIRRGLEAVEHTLQTEDYRKLADKMQVSLADICLIPQLYNAKRWSVDYKDLAEICSIEKRLAELNAFKTAAPV